MGHNRIKELRKKNDLTLLEVANKIGVAESTIQRYESQKVTKIKYETMVNLANVFGVRPEYMMGWTDEDGNSVIQDDWENPDTASSIAEILTDPDLLTHVKQLVKLSERKKQDIYDQIQYWYDRERAD